ncbi:MAG: NADH-quinone oxidoreductase subunit NuoE [Spirochaetales bacterium]|nr:MAG: NADH-quinone oxidoreductase subunit NuoE [Spirochaetales bacterium]
MPDQLQQSVDFKPAEEILQSFGNLNHDKLIPLLQKIQEVYGYLPVPVLSWMSKKTGIPESRMHGVITFYSQFYTEPHGRHTIRCCEGTACHVKGSPRIADRIIEELNVKPGETTKDMRFTFETVACLGTCFLAPVMMVNNDYYGQLTADKVAPILKNYT